MRKFTVPEPVVDVDLPMSTGAPFTQSFAIFLREQILSWTGWDESSEGTAAAVSVLAKFAGTKPGDVVELKEKEWELGCKAMDASQVNPLFKGALRPFRVAWKTATEVSEP